MPQHRHAQQTSLHAMPGQLLRHLVNGMHPRSGMFRGACIAATQMHIPNALWVGRRHGRSPLRAVRMRRVRRDADATVDGRRRRRRPLGGRGAAAAAGGQAPAVHLAAVACMAEGRHHLLLCMLLPVRPVRPLWRRESSLKQLYVALSLAATAPLCVHAYLTAR